MTTPKVTIIVLNYVRWQDTEECVRSLQKSTYPRTELLLVDNASPNDSEERLRKSFPTTPVLQTGANLGYTGGVNFGIRYAMNGNPDYLLVLNPDTTVDPGFLDRLVEAMEHDPKAGVACGTIFEYPGMASIWYAGGSFIWWRASGFSNTSPLELSRREVRPVSFATGCLMLFRTSVLRDVGHFDERFFMYLEDTEICLRLQSRGFRVLYVPDSTIMHKVSRGRTTPMSVYFGVRNRFLLASLVLKGARALIARAYLVVVFLLKCMAWSFARPALARAAVSGIGDYFRGRFHAGRGLSFAEVSPEHEAEV